MDVLCVHIGAPMGLLPIKTSHEQSCCSLTFCAIDICASRSSISLILAIRPAAISAYQGGGSGLSRLVCPCPLESLFALGGRIQKQKMD